MPAQQQAVNVSCKKNAPSVMKLYSFVLLLSILTSCQSQTNIKESTKLSNKSKILLLEDKIDEAEIVVEKSIQLDPTNYAAYNNRAFIKTKQNKPKEEVIEDYKKALRLKPNYDISLYSLTNYYFEIKDYESTIANANIFLDYSVKEDFDKTLIQHIYAISGESKYMIGEFDNAIIDIKKAIELDSDDAECHKLLGDCYLYKNSLTEALKELTTAIILNESYYQAYLARAKCYESLQDAKSMRLAELDFKKAFEINPKAEDIYNTNSTLFKTLKPN
jgi:tetratricopeptide (TPR) repeat protein